MQPMRVLNMTDKPKKTLTIIRHVSGPPTDKPETTTPSTVQRTGKRVLTKDKLQEAKPEKGADYYRYKPTKPDKPTKPADKTNAAKPVAKKPAKPKKKNIRSPSDLRAKELDASLNGFEVWRERKPLALQFERQIFQHIGKHSLSASKRVVMKLLDWHTTNRFYLQAVIEGGKRFNLDGTESGVILEHEQAYAAKKLALRKK